MKKYDSPTMEWMIVRTSDILSVSDYAEIIYNENGDMDDGGYSDIIHW